MKLLSLLFLIGCTAEVSFAADLTGHWLSKTTSPSGSVRETSLYLTANGETFTGYLSARGNNDAITNGKVSGNALSFDIVRDEFGDEKRYSYTGELAGTTLNLQAKTVPVRSFI